MTHSESKTLMDNLSLPLNDGWTQNQTLIDIGRVDLNSDGAVTIHNDHFTKDGALTQHISLPEKESDPLGTTRVQVTARILPEGNSGAAVSIVALDEADEEIQIASPFRIPHRAVPQWDTYTSTVTLPAETVGIRVELAVVYGSCTFADLTLAVCDDVEPQEAFAHVLNGRDFQFESIPVERPVWELLADDLDGDGEIELATCDVDGIVRIARPGEGPMTEFDAGSLVFQFGAADIDGDGVKELLVCTVDPKQELRAFDLAGKEIRSFPVKGFRRLEIGGEGEGLRIAAGDPNGLQVFDRDANLCWSRHEPTGPFAFDPLGGASTRLIVNTQRNRTLYTVYGPNGGEIEQYGLADEQRLPGVQVAAADIDGDGISEVIAYRRRHGVICLRGSTKCWETLIPDGYYGEFGFLRVANFCPEKPGLETALVGTHALIMFGSDGRILYTSEDPSPREIGWDRQWVPGGIRPFSVSLVGKEEPVLYLGSSAFRDPAIYRLRFGKPTVGFRSASVPDRETHLDSLFKAVQSRTADLQPDAQVSTAILTGGWGRADEGRLRSLRARLDELETPALQYVLMYDPSDLKGHDRGTKLTTDQVVERARLFEKLGLPFGYFAVHCCQVWLSDEAILRTMEAAPTTFRFLYVAEDFECFYEPLYRPFLAWCRRMLDICAPRGIKMVFKEKHDGWGLVAADPEVREAIFRPEFRDAIVPLYSTNQVYQPEVQWGGLLGLKAAGLCTEFGMSTQFWNYGEWGQYMAWETRDLNAAFCCPSDVTMRLELLGAALGGTWFHIEGGQPYLQSDPDYSFSPCATRHRELVYSLIRTGVLQAGMPVANMNRTAVIRSLPSPFEQSRAAGARIAYPYFYRNTEELRKGLLGATSIFEPLGDDAFQRFAYGSRWNGITCFPETPHGWVTILPPDTLLPEGITGVPTHPDGISDSRAVNSLKTAVQEGSSQVPLEAPGACLTVQNVDSGQAYRAILIDPGYLAPTGVSTCIRAPHGTIAQATDRITDEELPILSGKVPIDIDPGAFRIIDLRLE